MRSHQRRRAVHSISGKSHQVCKAAGRAVVEQLEHRRLLSVASISYTVFPVINSGTNFVQNLTAGPDGKIYFTSGLANNIGSMSTSGTVVNVYDTTSVADHGLSGVTVGADGNIWFDELFSNAAGELNLTTKTVIPLTITSTTKLNGPIQVTTGPDGNFWTECFDSDIQRYTPAGVVTTYPYTGSGSGPIISFNGKIYFGQGTGIGSISTSGVFGTTYLPGAGGNIESLTVGPDGNLWYTQAGSGNDTNNHYGYVTPGGTVHDFTIANSYGTIGDIAVPADDNIYFRAGDYIFGVNTAGTMIATQNIGESDTDLIAGPDGNLWFNESMNDQLGVAYIHGTTITVSPPPHQTATVGQSQLIALGGFTQSYGTAPFSVDVQWGDGTADTTIPVAAAGAIPATDHTFTTGGSDTVMLAVTDSASHTSKTGTFTVTVDPTTSVFSKLTTSSSIAQGTASATFSGTITAGALIPPTTESVAVTLDSVTQYGMIDSQGDFSTSFNTSTLPASTTPYQVTYTYYGDASFNSITDNTTTTLLVMPTGGTSVSVWRLYSQVTKEHLYTADPNEYATLGTEGWDQEGLAYTDYNGLATIGGVTTEPLYRLYNIPTKQHLWTTDPNEYNTLKNFVGTWSVDGISGYILPANGSTSASLAAVPGSAALYRMSWPFNPSDGLHLWTTDLNEYDTDAATYGWTKEGVIGYVM